MSIQIKGVAKPGDDSLRIAVICEELIREGLKENENIVGIGNDGKGKQKKKMLMNDSRDEDGGNVQQLKREEEEEEKLLEEIQVLRLSYKNILRIDNLNGLEALHTLCLDNNIIEEICNLDHLVNLMWLDLSFNNITKIQGLENLRNLKDLSLYNNNIDTIEGLDNCENLECLSIGNNKINKLENILYLRQFKKLRLVTVEGNPVCSDPECRIYILAYLPSLKYLDYALIDENEVISAKEQNQDELLEAQEREALEEANQKAAAAHQAYLERLKQAHLIVVETLFTEMFKEDKELSKLKLLPGFDVIIDSYQHEFRVQAEATINKGLELHQVSEKEVERFFQAMKDVRMENETHSIKLVEAFNKLKKTSFQKVNESKQQKAAALSLKDNKQSLQNDEQANEILLDAQTLQQIKDDLLTKLDELRDELMSIEMQQIEQLSSLRDIFENRATPGKTERLDKIQQFFRAVEDLENSWFSAVEELAQNLVEKFSNELLEDLSDDITNLLSDKDNLMVAVQSAHDIHLGKLLAQEDLIRDSLVNYYTFLVKNTKDEHAQQNRARVSEIQRLTKQYQNEIENTFAEDGTEEDDILL